MDSFNSQKTKSRKIKRLAKKSRAQIILDLFYRAIEIALVLVTAAKLCYQLVITLHDSGVAAAILANRNLAFVIANAIVIALIAKSGLLLNQEVVPNCKSNDLDLYDEVRNRGKQSEAENKATQSIIEARAKQREAEKETESITETIAKYSIPEKIETRSKPEKSTKHSTSVQREKQSKVEHQETTAKKMEKQSLAEKMQSQSYQRSRSENLEGLEKSPCGRLRRSETDASSERFDSDDELRFKIESFIARQRRNQYDMISLV
ncbi:uncharacterized protein LOC108822833 [Raphanus sativus]|uniref:Uncharacterized protein LOC108822833 n=1 Tax=Raphanus sativus TaxID=3726 RepID=A0A6J0KVA5_RAPSA|nr:PREDICTED: uncharacterized protein LOC108821954 [Raphanus sativus]XP_018451518.1 uncharacterized protein LOC108822833 [Raphanus sativus]